MSKVQNKVKNKKSKHYEIYKDTEAIDIIKSVLTAEEYIGFLKGNVLKYQLRLGKKDNIKKELVKINDYKNEIEEVNNQTEDKLQEIADEEMIDVYKDAFVNLSNYGSKHKIDTELEIERIKTIKHIKDYFIYKGFANTTPKYCTPKPLKCIRGKFYK